MMSCARSRILPWLAYRMRTYQRVLIAPPRMHEWMPRLASEGVVGADAIFACLGPALEIFSRYSRVEKANGDRTWLLWAAIAVLALALLFGR